MASQDGHAAIAEMLLARGADVDKANQDGATPLFMASRNGHAAVAELLLARGANFNSTTSGGSTPLQIARERGAKTYVQALELPSNADARDAFTAGRAAQIVPELLTSITEAR